MDKQIWWEVTGLATSPKRVEVVNETIALITVVCQDGTTELRRKDTSWRKYFATQKEAWDFLERKAFEKVQVSVRDAKEAQKELLEIQDKRAEGVGD